MKALFLVLAAACVVHAQAPSNGGSKSDQQKFSSASDFAFDFYKKLASATDGSKNIFFSPLSIYSAFGMLKAGAKGTSEQQMETVLRWQKLIEDSESVDGHKAIESLLSEVFAPLEKNNTISFANKLWLQKYFCSSLCDNYINTLKKSYKAELGQPNFAREAESARQEINKWVEDKTNQKIKDLLPEGSVNGMTRVVLTNAIYFKSKWQNPFEKKHTTQRPFQVIHEVGAIKKKNVPTMYQNVRLNAAGFDPSTPYQIAELPYEGGKLSMLIVVPKELEAFRKFEENISSAKISKLMDELYRYPSIKTDVYLPKFKVTSQMSLKDQLVSLGMKDVFNPQKADLSGITGYRGLYVSDAVHKAYVNVDEEGTEAAAATGIIIKLASLPFQFRVDRPFIFMIRHVPTNTILFMGRVIDPTAE